MRKAILVIMTISLGLLFISCGNKVEKSLYVIGEASNENLSTAKERADQNAIDELNSVIGIMFSDSLKKLAENMIKNTELDTANLEFNYSTSKEVPLVDEQDCQIVKRESEREGSLYRCYTLVKCDLHTIITNYKKAIIETKEHYDRLEKKVQKNIDAE